jgi:hypothetical protein
VDRNTFDVRLRTAAQQALKLARQCVRQALPDELAFLVYPNKSYDGNPRVGDEVVFPDESLHGKHHGPWSAEEVVDFLWREGKVPEWIDAYVQAEDGQRTLIALYCCGRFTAQEELLYHRHAGGVPPFQSLGPSVPLFWESIESSGKIDLYWQEQMPPPDDPIKLTGPACWSFWI